MVISALIINLSHILNGSWEALPQELMSRKRMMALFFEELKVYWGI